MDQQDIPQHTEVEHEGWNITSATPETELRQELEPSNEPAPTGTPSPAGLRPREDTPPPAASDPQSDPASAEPAAPVAAPKPGSPEGRVAQLRAEINQLTREKHSTKTEKAQIEAELAEKRAERDAVQREINAARARATDPDAAETAGDEGVTAKRIEAGGRTPEPDEDDFPDFREWVKAHAKWTREQTALDVEEARQREQAQSQQQAQQQAAQQYQYEIATAHKNRIDAYAKANPGFVELINSGADLPTNDAIQAHVLHSEMGPAIMRYLVENPAECERLAALGVGPTFVELGKIEARLAPAKSGSGAGRQSVTKAEPPINPVGTSATAADAESDEDLASMPFSEDYVRKMNARDRKRDQARRL